MQATGSPPPSFVMAVLLLMAVLAIITLNSETASSQSPGEGPRNLSVQISDHAVVLSWDAPSGDAESVTGYQILRRRPFEGERTLLVLVNDTGSTDTTYADLNATEPGVRYVYRVKAWRKGVLSRRSNYDRTDLPHNFIPAAVRNKPTNLTVELLNDYVTLNWNVPLRDAESITGYEILRRRPFKGESTLMTLVNDTGSTDTTYADLNATEPGVRYVYRVKALRNGTKSLWSNYDRIKLPQNYSAPLPIIPTTITLINSSDISEDNETYTYDYSTEENVSIVKNISINIENEEFVYITASDNAAPVFNQTSYTFNLTENRDGSTTPISLGFVNATDADNNVLTYSITTGESPFIHPGKFNINSSTGEITYNGGGEDFEDTTTYQLIAKVDDGTISNGVFVHINIDNVEGEAPEFGREHFSNDLPENMNNVYLFSPIATDDDGDNLTYSITEGNTSKFSVRSSGDVYYIGGGEDYESLIASGTDHYNFTIQVSDSSFNVSANFTVTITNVNEAPEFPGDVASDNLEENLNGSSGSGIIVGIIPATDPDGDNLTCSITEGNTSKFRIDFNYGTCDVYYIGGGEDYEGLLSSGFGDQYDLTLTVSDGFLNDTIDYDVFVENVNEAPEFPEYSQAYYLDENVDGSSNHVSIGILNASDEDGDNLTFSITTEEIPNTFAINSTTGEITYIGNGEDYEDNPDHGLSVKVSDGSLSNIGLAFISINDVEEPPEFNQGSYTFTLGKNLDGSSTPVLLGNITATEDDGDTLNYSITSGDASRFKINSTNGKITYIGQGEGSISQYHLVVEVDDGDFTDTADVHIYVGIRVNICGRTWWVRNKILQITPLNDKCNNVDLDELAAITEIDFNGYGDAHMQVGDFDNLTGLLRLDLSDIGIGLIHNEDGSYPNRYTHNLGGLFRDLTNLEYLSLRNNRLIPRLPDDSFKNLGNLRELDVRGYSRTPGGRTGDVNGGKSLGACWSFEEKAQIHPDYPWDPRKNSPNAFKPLTSLETYNFDRDFNTENIYSVGSEIPIFSTNITLTQTSQYIVAYGSDVENSSIDNDTFSVGSDDYVIEYFSLQAYNNNAVLRFNKPLTKEIISTGGIKINNDEVKYFVESDIRLSGREVRFENLKVGGEVFDLNGTAALFTVVLRPVESQYDYEPVPYATNNYVQPPASPQNVGVSENGKVFTITWDAPENVNGLTHYRIERGLNPGRYQAEKRRAGIISSAGPNVQCTGYTSNMITDYSRFANYVNTVDASQTSYADDLSGKLPLGHSSIGSLHYHVYAITEDGESLPVTVKAT